MTETDRLSEPELQVWHVKILPLDRQGAVHDGARPLFTIACGVDQAEAISSLEDHDGLPRRDLLLRGGKLWTEAYGVQIGLFECGDAKCPSLELSEALVVAMLLAMRGAAT